MTSQNTRAAVLAVLEKGRATGHAGDLHPPLVDALLVLADAIDAKAGGVPAGAVALVYDTAGAAVTPKTPAPAAAAKSPLDHDGDGQPGGSLPAAERLPADLLAEAAALGLAVDHRWSEETLRVAVGEAKGAVSAQIESAGAEAQAPATE